MTRKLERFSDLSKTLLLTKISTNNQIQNLSIHNEKAALSSEKHFSWRVDCLLESTLVTAKLARKAEMAVSCRLPIWAWYGVRVKMAFFGARAPPSPFSRKSTGCDRISLMVDKAVEKEANVLN